MTTGTLSATGNVDVDGAAVTLADVTAGTDVTIDGTDAVEVGAVTAESAAITGSGVTFTGAATVTGALAIDAKDNLADIDAALTAGSLSVRRSTVRPGTWRPARSARRAMSMSTARP